MCVKAKYKLKGNRKTRQAGKGCSQGCCLTLEYLIPVQQFLNVHNGKLRFIWLIKKGSRKANARCRFLTFKEDCKHKVKVMIN